MRHNGGVARGAERGYGNGTTTSGTATARATYYAATLPGFAQPAPHALNSHGATPNSRGVDDSFRGEHDISRHFPRGSCHYPHRSCHQSRRNSAAGAAGQNGTGKRNGLVQAGQGILSGVLRRGTASAEFVEAQQEDACCGHRDRFCDGNNNHCDQRDKIRNLRHRSRH